MRKRKKSQLNIYIYKYSQSLFVYLLEYAYEKWNNNNKIIDKKRSYMCIFTLRMCIAACSFASLLSFFPSFSLYFVRSVGRQTLNGNWNLFQQIWINYNFFFLLSYSQILCTHYIWDRRQMSKKKWANNNNSSGSEAMLWCICVD